MKKYKYQFFIAALFILLGFVFYPTIQNYIIGNINQSAFAHKEMSSQLFDSIKFGLLCGIIPLFFTFL